MALQAGGIRIVTSLAKSPAAALEDLKLEASKLQGTGHWVPCCLPRRFTLSLTGAAAETSTDPTVTTLLVCPGVEEWQDFADFNDFRENALGMLGERHSRMMFVNAAA